MKKDWFIHVEWVVVLVTLLGGFYMLDGKIERQGTRIDRLYDIWVEGQKDFHNEMKQLRKEGEQRWYQVQNDINLVRKENNEKWYQVQNEIKELYKRTND